MAPEFNYKTLLEVLITHLEGICIVQIIITELINKGHNCNSASFRRNRWELQKINIFQEVIQHVPESAQL